MIQITHDMHTSDTKFEGISHVIFYFKDFLFFKKVFCTCLCGGGVG